MPAHWHAAFVTVCDTAPSAPLGHYKVEAFLAPSAKLKRPSQSINLRGQTSQVPRCLSSPLLAPHAQRRQNKVPKNRQPNWRSPVSFTSTTWKKKVSGNVYVARDRAPRRRNPNRTRSFVITYSPARPTQRDCGAVLAHRHQEKHHHRPLCSAVLF